MEVKIEVSYKDNKKTATLIGGNISTPVLTKMVTAVCGVLHQELVESLGVDESAGINWSISFKN